MSFPVLFKASWGSVYFNVQSWFYYHPCSFHLIFYFSKYHHLPGGQLSYKLGTHLWLFTPPFAIILGSICQSSSYLSILASSLHTHCYCSFRPRNFSFGHCNNLLVCFFTSSHSSAIHSPHDESALSKMKISPSFSHVQILFFLYWLQCRD